MTDVADVLNCAETIATHDTLRSADGRYGCVLTVYAGGLTVRAIACEYSTLDALHERIAREVAEVLRSRPTKPERTPFLGGV